MIQKSPFAAAIPRTTAAHEALTVTLVFFRYHGFDQIFAVLDAGKDDADHMQSDKSER